jgi:hypothetical protein
MYTIARVRQAEAVMLTYTAVIVQCEINEKMRGILVDWLVEVHLKFKVSSIACVAVDLPLTATTYCRAVRGRPQASLQQHQAGKVAASV